MVKHCHKTLFHSRFMRKAKTEVAIHSNRQTTGGYLNQKLGKKQNHTQLSFSKTIEKGGIFEPLLALFRLQAYCRVLLEFSGQSTILKKMFAQRQSPASQTLAKKIAIFRRETQISIIIRTRTKSKRTILLEFHQFYSAKKYPKGYA